MRQADEQPEHEGNMQTSKAPQLNSLGWSPFHAAARDYYNAGYYPIPLPEGKKFPPPLGVPNDIEIDSEQVEDWLEGKYAKKDGSIREDKRSKNIGCVVPDGTVVFDIDGAAARETLIELENTYGTLPATWCSTRGNPDRYHLWFTIPAGMTWPGKLAAGI